jgi:hypothetical protein
MYVLVKFQRDWADEFYAEGFALYELNEWKKIAEKFIDNDNNINEYYFGTNEGWDDDTCEDFFESYTSTVIDEATYEAIKSQFPEPFGIFPDPYELLD